MGWHRVAVFGLPAVAACAALLLWRRRVTQRRLVTRSWPGLEVRRSRVAGAGDGLFATRAYAAGELIGEYYGRVLSLHQATQLENRDYLMGGFG
jgi:hypothetical protein